MNEMATASGRSSNTVTKVERFGWTIKDAPGVMTLLDKKVLQIHQDYQRQAIVSKIRAITATWSWVACGAIIVGKRCGEYWVIDGQHRVLAARQRADITALRRAPAGLRGTARRGGGDPKYATPETAGGEVR